MKFPLRFASAAALMCLAASTPAQNSGSIILTCSDTNTTSEIPLADGSPVSINSDGNLEATATECPTGGTGTATVTVDEIKPSPLTVEQGAEFSANIGSLGARSCTRSSGEPALVSSGWDATNASPRLPGHSINVSVGSTAVPGEYTLRHVCRNGDVSKSAPPVTIQVVAPDTSSDPGDPVPVSCNSIPLPDRWSRETTPIAGSFTNKSTWQQVYGVPFPDGSSVNAAAGEDKYIALQFDLSSLGGATEGLINHNTLSNAGISNVGTRKPVFSISECPGDFRAELGSACRRLPGSTAEIKWATHSRDPARCVLEPDKTYYLNMAYATWYPEANKDDPTSWYWACDSSGSNQCGSLLTPNSN